MNKGNLLFLASESRTMTFTAKEGYFALLLSEGVLS